MTAHPPSDRLVVLNIGLPRSGTGFLARKVFARAPEIDVVARRLAPGSERLLRDLRRYVRAPALIASFLRWRVATGLRAVAPADPGTLVICDETLAVDAYSLWRDRGPAPEAVAARLADLGQSIAPLGQLRVLIGVRRQDEWLAARYAGSAARIGGFSQLDFDRRVARHCAMPALSGPWRWADYAAVEAAFAGRLGTENVMLVSHERLVSAPVLTTRALGRFLGATLRDGPARRHAARAAAKGEIVRRLAGARTLRVTRDVREMILERFGPANAELAARAELGF